MSRSARLAFAAALLLAFAGAAVAQAKKDALGSYGIGHTASPELIAGWDIDARPDGQGIFSPSGTEPRPGGETVGSYFPYLSSVFDYVRRSMPFGDAQSLSNDELYAVVTYVLNLNDIVDDKFVLSKETWDQVKMPNQGGFFDDDREKTEKAFWNPTPCMKDCSGPVKITGPCAGDRRYTGRKDAKARGGIRI